MKTFELRYDDFAAGSWGLIGGNPHREEHWGVACHKGLLVVWPEIVRDKPMVLSLHERDSCVERRVKFTFNSNNYLSTADHSITTGDLYCTLKLALRVMLGYKDYVVVYISVQQ